MGASVRSQNVWPPRRGVRILLAVTAITWIGMAAFGQTTSSATLPAAEAVQAPPRDPTVWEMFRGGGSVMWVLAAGSVVALAIVFERLYALRRDRVIPPAFFDGLRAVYRHPRDDRGRALDYCRAHDSPMARMVAAFVKRLPRGPEAAEKAMEDAGGNEALKLRQNMRFLYAIGSVATLLGLIGTIAGMIAAFQETAKMGAADNKVERLSAGIYQAMVCTFGGLAVAILVTVFYYFLATRIEKLVGDINDELERFADEFGPDAEADAERGATAGTARPR